MKLISKLTLAAVLLAGSGALMAAPGCSVKILQGDYGFTITGQILARPTAGPVAGVALTTFDGNGKLTQVDHVVHNGVLPPATDPWRPAAGSYTLDSNCTGTMTLVFTDGTPTMNLHIVVTAFGNEVRTVVDGDVAITSIGNRVGLPF